MQVTAPIHFEDRYGNYTHIDSVTLDFKIEQDEIGWVWHTKDLKHEGCYCSTYEECAQSAITYTENLANEKQEECQDEYDRAMYNQNY